MTSPTGNKAPFFPTGFTLVEVLFAVLILSIGIIGILRVYATALNAVEAGDIRLACVQALKEKISELDDAHDTAQAAFEGECVIEVESRPGPIEGLDELKFTVYNIRRPGIFSATTYVRTKEE